ncbi:helix-turn-helix domain-containing protein [Rhodohalobacter halophilus]|uniref:helix-turn-helix domain-containing protein n=1 Tax=Rhodohalobacter halophilus TaxID=1812810 RepID=UPI00083FB2B8|nr:AraC family transcriptional regulator [Rhodohalobacter halophilus]
MDNNKKIRVIEECLEEFQERYPQLSSDLPVQIRNAALYIHGHLFEFDLTVASLKKEFRIKNNNFSSLFKNFTGYSPRKYIIHYRILAAKKLLRNKSLEDLTIADIAYALGYLNYETFWKNFLKETGVTPLEWKTKEKNQEKK